MLLSLKYKKEIIFKPHQGDILSFSISDKADLNFVVELLYQVLPILEDAKYPIILHSDQGWDYQHQKWVQTLKQNNIFQSMSRKGNCLNNSPMEIFFGILNYGKTFKTYEELKEAIEEYIDYYNYKRIKRKLAGMSLV